LHFEPVLDALLRAVVLSMRQPGEFDAAAHIDGIDGGRRELIHARVPPENYSGSNQRHAAADHVHRNHIETFSFVRGELPEISSEQIGKWPRGIDALVPSGKW